MAARHLTLAPLARIDLSQIGEYLTIEAGERTAMRIVDRLERRANELADNPLVGATDTVLGADRRRLVVGSYLVVYRHDETSVTILRIVHGARDLPALFGG